MPKIIFADIEYAGKDLTDDENAILDRHVKGYLCGENTFLRSLVNFSWASVQGALMVAKEKFDAPFKGLLAGDGEIGVQITRPGHVLRTTDSTETCSNSWAVTLTTSTDYWIGYSTDNTTAMHVDKDLLMLWLGIEFTSGVEPKVEEVFLQVGNKIYPVIVVRRAWQADNPNQIRAVRIHPILLEPKATAIAQTRCIAACTNELVIVGLSFGLGRFLRVQSYTTVST